MAGTVGRRLNTNGSLLFSLVNDAAKEEENQPYATIALYAWLPESYLLDRQGAWGGPMPPVLATSPDQREGGPALYAIKSLATGKYFNEDDGTHLGACRGNWGEAQIVHKLLRYAPLADKPSQNFLRYGDQISLYSDGRELAPVGTNQYYSENHMKYCPRPGCGSGWENRIRFLIRPAPTLVSRLLDPAKYALPRLDTAVLLRNISRGKDITVTDHDWLWTEECDGAKARFTIQQIH